MVNNIFNKTTSAVYAFIAAVTLSGCGSEQTTVVPPNPIQTATVHSQLNTHLRSTFKNLVAESNSPSSKALKSTLESIQRLIGDKLGISLPSDIDVAGITKIVEIVFESELVQEIFSESNILIRTDTEVTYDLKMSLCDKLSELVPSSKDSLVDSCRLLLEKNAFEFRVKSLPNDAMELELWHGSRNAESVKKFVISLDMSANSFGARLNLDGVKSLLAAVAELLAAQADGEDAGIPGFPIEALKKLSGALSMQLRFISDTAESGCKNNERLCFVANVDEDLDLEIDLGQLLTLTFAKSPKSNPTITISSSSNNGFKGLFNLGKLEGNFAALHLFLEASQFGITIPEVKEGSGFEVIVENFKAGNLPSYFQGFGKKFVLDLAHESRMIEKLRVALNADKTLLELSPFKLNISVIDERNLNCKAYETISLSTDATSTTQLQFLNLPKLFAHNSQGFDSMTTAKCDESSLMAYMIWSLLVVTSDNCNEAGSLLVTQGSLDLGYDYHLNDNATQTSVLNASTGQCLRM